MEGEEEDDDQRVLERGEWFEGKRQKENEKMKATDSEHLNHSTLRYIVELALQRSF